MKTIAWDDKTSCDEIVRQAEQEDVVLMKEGHPVALVTAFDDDDLDWYAREHDPAFLASIARARRQVQEGQTIRHDQLKRELGIE
jgi:hypothetical protein